MNEKLSNRLYSVIQSILESSNRTTGNPFIDMDRVGFVILDACANPTVSNIKKLMESYTWTCTDVQAEEIKNIIDEVRNMPVNMFEAKPLRVVGFDEIRYAIIPDNISTEARELIEEKNIPIKEYASGDEEARLGILNSLGDVQFSDRYIVPMVADRLTHSEWNMLNKLVGSYNKGDIYQKSAEGDIIIPIGNKLIYTDAKLGDVGISKIIEFVSEYEDDIDRARRIIYDFEKGKSEIEDAYETIENYFGDGFVTEYSTGTVQKNERFDRRTKRGKSKSDAYHSNFRKATIEKARRIAGFVENDKQYSDRDSEGTQLSPEQVEYFKDSKARDENGNLLALYHGSKSMAFTKFYAKDGIWATPKVGYAELYAEEWHSWGDDYEDSEPRTDINGLEKEVYSDDDC